MLIDVEVPPGWAFHIYHRKNSRYHNKGAGFSVSMARASYAQKSFLVKGDGKTLEEAMRNMKEHLAECAKGLSEG